MLKFTPPPPPPPSTFSPVSQGLLEYRKMAYDGSVNLWWKGCVIDNSTCIKLMTVISVADTGWIRIQQGKNDALKNEEIACLVVRVTLF
jgi:hypothetical protein